MPILHQVLGAPGRDNALLLRIDSGQRVTRLLFDCGDGCLSNLSISEIQSIDHLLFSHLHMDHIGGFDSFFRCNFNRTNKPNLIWGPEGTSRILHHRFQGFLWNLVEGTNTTWKINDISVESIDSYNYELSEAFSIKHFSAQSKIEHSILHTDDFSISAIVLPHHGDCIGYVVREKPKTNIQKDKIQDLGLKPGPWMQHLKNQSLTGEITIDGNAYSLETLRSTILVESEADSVAYITDFLLNDETMNRLTHLLKGVDRVICEAQYSHNDIELATKNHHTTVRQVANLANTSKIGKLFLFHLSDRYDKTEWTEMLTECRSIFKESYFPEEWEI